MWVQTVRNFLPVQLFNGNFLSAPLPALCVSLTPSFHDLSHIQKELLENQIPKMLIFAMCAYSLAQNVISITYYQIYGGYYARDRQMIICSSQSLHLSVLCQMYPSFLEPGSLSLGTHSVGHGLTESNQMRNTANRE